jgi:anti-sigma factor RsiW
MNCASYEQDLGAYIDGAPDTTGALDAHLAECARCRALAADLRAIRTAARTLPPPAPPSRVWAQMSAAVRESRRGVPFQRVWSYAITRPIASAAAAAAVLVLVWVGTTLAPLAPPSDIARMDPLPAEVRMAEEQITTAIHGLEQIAHAEAEALDPETHDVIQVNLTVIDQAIGESRAALEAEPSNDLALESLFDALRSKLMLLQDMVVLINEMRKGNQEEAARIASELNP